MKVLKRKKSIIIPCGDKINILVNSFQVFFLYLIDLFLLDCCGHNFGKYFIFLSSYLLSKTFPYFEKDKFTNIVNVQKDSI